VGRRRRPRRHRRAQLHWLYAPEASDNEGVQPFDPEMIRTHLRRTSWGDFPDVVIHAEESRVKKHPHYAAAKAGDPAAAETLILDCVTLDALDWIDRMIGHRTPYLLPVQAVEAAGVNVIPGTLAECLSVMLRLPVVVDIVQINRVSHTGSGGYHRLAHPALFEGPVLPGDYFLVDDFIGQGGTLANLRGFLERGGGRVLGATVLTGKAYSAKLKLEAVTLEQLRSKHGQELEDWWHAAFGFGFDGLTESEARYLLRADHAHTITERVAAAMRKGAS
jgi:hypoxanthine-guanine phosphoribosyltransferase